MSARDAALAAYLAAHGLGHATLEPIPGDASLRRYFRLRGAAGIVMDAPPPHEDVRPFIKVAELLRGYGMAVPAISQAAPDNGFLIVEDFGDLMFSRLFTEEPAHMPMLYGLAVDALAHLHGRADAAMLAGKLPAFDDARAMVEAERPLDWLWPAVHGSECPADVRATHRAAWTAIMPAWRGVTHSVVHFDYILDNLVWRPEREGIAACGWIDFQDAVIGPYPFDLMSLMQDVRRDVAPDLEAAMIDRYLAYFPALDRDAFRASYAVGGAQRNARILGTFVRLWKRDGKPKYLAHMPRVWRMLERNLAQPALAPVTAWYDRHFPAALRAQPLPGAPA